MAQRPPCSLDEVIPPEIIGDKFYFAILNLARSPDVKLVLEIGSSSGAGSTDAFVRGLRQHPSHPTLFCMEVSEPRFKALAARYAAESFVKCYHASSVPVEAFPSEQEVADFYRSTPTKLNQYPLEQILGWLRTDVQYVREAGVEGGGIARIKRQHHIQYFDLVLIDGSEFTGVPELEEVYGSKYIMLDDVLGYKNHHNYRRLREDAGYRLREEDLTLRSGYAIFERIGAASEMNTPAESTVAVPKDRGESLPVHFFTIVLNGEPYVRHQIRQFARLPFRWHWHIVEGVASLKHDTAWSLATGGSIPNVHDHGRSKDGTSEYLDILQAEYPANVTIYRKPPDQFWDGKIEMIQSTLRNIQEEAVLWEIDVDEFWTPEQFAVGRQMYLDHPEKTAGLYRCHFFVGPDRITVTPGGYGNPDSAWIRTWRYRPGMVWAAHEPPKLAEKTSENQWRDVRFVNPFLHAETEAAGLVFQHFAYATIGQLEFKERYYGYGGAAYRWHLLQRVKAFPVRLRDYFHWVTDDCMVDRAEGRVPPLLIELPPAPEFKPPHHLVLVRTDAIGDNVLASPMLPLLATRYPGVRITVVCRDYVAPLYDHCPLVSEVIPFNHEQAFQNAAYRSPVAARIQTLHADVCVNASYARDPLADFFVLNSGARETVALKRPSNPTDSAAHASIDAQYSRLIPSPGAWKPELERYRDILKGLGVDVPPLPPLVWQSPDEKQAVADFIARRGLDPANLVVLFASALYNVREYEPFGKALRAVCQERGLQIVAIGDVAGAALSQRCLDDAGVPSLNLCGKTTLQQSMELLRICRLAVGGETGLAHIACALGTPNVVLLGGGHFGRFMPYSPLTSVVCFPMTCYGCNWRCRFSRAHCVKDIVPEVVEYAIRQALDGPVPENPRVYVQDHAFAALPPGTEPFIHPDMLPPMLMDFTIVAPEGTPPRQNPPATISGCLVKFAYIPRHQSPQIVPAGVQVLGKQGGGLIVTFGKSAG